MGEPESHLLFEEITRRSRWVGVAKIVLLIVAILVLISLVVISFRQSSDNRFNLVFSSIETDGEMVPTMVNPRFHGLDKDNNPYNVTAKKAIQQDDDTVVMEEIRADLTLKSKNWLSVISPHGTLKLAKKMLYFDAGVELFHDQGYDMKSESAQVDMDAGRASSQAPVIMKGALGVLEASSFVVDDTGKYMRFEGNVKMILYPRSGE